MRKTGLALALLALLGAAQARFYLGFPGGGIPWLGEEAAGAK